MEQNLQKIETLLSKREIDKKLAYYLDKYKEINDFLNIKPTLISRLAKMINKRHPLSSDYPIYVIKDFDYSIQLNTTVDCTELLIALCEYYEKRIIEISQQEI
jgi:hypothetical protein